MTAPACGSCGAATGDSARLCQGCTRDLGQALLTAASIAPDLDDAVARLMVRGDRGPRGSEPVLPVDLAASDAAAELRIQLMGGVQVVMAMGAPSEGEYVPYSVRPMATWLLKHLGTLRQYSQAQRLHKGIRAAVDRAVAVVDRRPERMPAGLCPLCRVELFAEVGADTAACPACGYAVTGIQARRRERAAAADVLGTPGEISGALERIGISVPRGTITSWASRGRLAARPGGVYALSDVLALKAESDSRGAR